MSTIRRLRVGLIGLLMLMTITTADAQICSTGASTFVMGLDASYTDMLNYGYGLTYSNSSGTVTDFYSIVSGYKNYNNQGVDYIRLRLWNNPGNGGWDNLPDVLYMAQRAKNAGMGVVLDIHFSDTWADPSHQAIPSAWSSDSYTQLETDVYNWTNQAVGQLISQGTPPAYVEVGNEITNGILFPYGEVGGSYDTPAQWAALAGLLESGINGIKATGSTAKIILHIDSGNTNDYVGQWFFDNITAQNVPFDVIGVSYYPVYHGPFSVLSFEVSDLRSRYGKPVMVMETGYPWTLSNFDSEGNVISSSSQLTAGFDASPAGQQNFFQTVVALTQGAGGAGVFFWGGEWLGNPQGSSYDNQTLFDNNGVALPALGVFSNHP